VILRQPVTNLHEQPSNGRPGQITSMFVLSVLHAVLALEKTYVLHVLSASISEVRCDPDQTANELADAECTLTAPVLVGKATHGGRVHVPAK